ncbi:UNKNOWN [Stylonychia lemnae]|uniref:Uncharacterized protein n=1 Tax=Stylonychia lemnae TaxID=5949 RepID=A0A078B1M8_STYLE|nr:UNKNOWN [Stylonychia lemnae]|eukprot:CDW87188.1 UNKNOWN [Stylonychia lemnae]
MADPFRRNYGAGDYSNTSNNRIKDTLAKAQSILLDDPFQSDGLSIGGGLDRHHGGGAYSGLPPSGAIQRNSSQPPIYQSYGGLKSNYTGSEADPSEFDTHSQIKRRQWGNPSSNDNQLFNNDFGLGGGGGLGIKLNSNDLGDLNDIGTLNAPGSRRGSFRAPITDTESQRNRGSESKERIRDQISTGFGGLPRQSDNQLGLRRPQTSDPPNNLLSGQYTISGHNNNLYSEAGSMRDDDALSHIMGQSQFDAISNIGGSAIPTLDINKGPTSIPSRRMAAKQTQGDNISQKPPTMTKPQSTNYGLFLSEDKSKMAPSQDMRRQNTALNQPAGGLGLGLGLGGNVSNNLSGLAEKTVSPPRRDQNDFMDIGFGRPQTGLGRDRGALSGGADKNSNDGGRQIVQGSHNTLFLSTDIVVSRPSATNLGFIGSQGAALGPTGSGGIVGGLTLGLDSYDKQKAEKEEKELYIKKKKQEELELLEQELKGEREKSKKQEDDLQKQLDEFKDKLKKDLDSIEESQKLTLDLILQEKEKTMETLQEAIAREKQKMEVLHQADLESKERQHQNQLEQQKRQLEKETSHLEEQLQQQQELHEALDKVQQRTENLSELVQAGLKQREDELKRREIEMMRKERQVQEDEEIEIAMEEKRIEEEERRLQRMKEDLLKNKSNFNSELERLREHRKQVRVSNEIELSRQKQEERHTKELLSIEKSKVVTEDEKRKTKQRIAELELSNKENECENMKTRINKERDDFESEVKERFLREIQIIQIKIEERREALSQKEGELRKKWRFLEKKKEVIKQDWEDYYSKISQFEGERKEFDEWAKKIRDTSLRLAEERDKVMIEKQTYDYEREKLEKWKMDLDLQRSILQSDYIRAEELEHELDHREKMLQMLKFNREAGATDVNVPPYSSCPALKIDPRQYVLGQTNANQCNHLNHNAQDQQFSDQQIQNPYPEQMQAQYFYPQQQNQQDISYVSGGPQMMYQQQEGSPSNMIPQKRFDYNQYIQEIQNKLGSDSVFRQKQSFNNYMQKDINQFQKDLSAVSENEVSLSQANVYKNGINRPNLVLGGNSVAYGQDSINQSSEIMARKSNNVSGLTGQGKDKQFLRDQIKARLGNAQLSESKQFDSSGMEEQDQEESNEKEEAQDYGSEY